MTFLQRFIRLFFTLISPIFPGLAGKMAFELFQRPHSKKTRERELALYSNFTERRIAHPEEDLYIYEKGPKTGYPLLMIHGWDSNPGSMYAIADRFQKDGFKVMVLGLPAHGKSRLKKSNMVHSSRVIRHLLEKEGLNGSFSMITHSFGSGATSLALKESAFSIDKMIFLTTPDRIWDIFVDFRTMIKLGKRAYQKLVVMIERLTPIKLKDFNISEFLLDVDYKELVIFHDQADKILPFKNAESVKKTNPKAELIALSGKGHYRLLWDEEVIEMIREKFENVEM